MIAVAPSEYGRCSRCHRSLAWGETKYLVRVSFTADFDGVLLDEGGAEAIPELLRRMKDRSAEELEDEVHSQVDYLLCKPCRDVLGPDPLGIEAGGADGAGLVH